MLTHPQNGWFQSCEFPRAAQAIFEASPLVYLDAKMYDCKYLQLYVDQRTKSFIIRTGAGEMLTEEQVYAMFPQLRTPVEIVSAGVRPYPE